jgi:hypothetical protein
MKRKTLEMGSAFLETPVESSGNNTSGQDLPQQIKKQKSSGKIAHVSKPAFNNNLNHSKPVL